MILKGLIKDEFTIDSNLKKDNLRLKSTFVLSKTTTNINCKITIFFPNKHIKIR